MTVTFTLYSDRERDTQGVNERLYQNGRGRETVRSLVLNTQQYKIVTNPLKRVQHAEAVSHLYSVYTLFVGVNSKSLTSFLGFLLKTNLMKPNEFKLFNEDF